MSQPIEYTTTVTDECTTTRVNGKLHSINDQPAKTHANGYQQWYNHGNIHRDGDQPAVIHANGDQRWYNNGNCHRDDDKPATVSTLGQIWYVHGKVHRDGDQPAVIHANGDQCWYNNGKKHRDNNKPAEIGINGTEHWSIIDDNDQPAEIAVRGIRRWYIHGVRQPIPAESTVTVVSETTFITNRYPIDYCNMAGVVTQNITIGDDNKSSVIYKLSFDNGITNYKYTLDIPIVDLNNISEMRVLKNDGWSISAMVNDTWITGVPCQTILS